MLLTINSKMKRSAKGKGFKIMNFTLPAFQSKTGLRTCPMAGNCAAGCYAKMGAYVWKNVAAKHESNLAASLKDSFVSEMSQEILRVKPTHVRIHDSGDFYSAEYLEKWVQIAFMNPSVRFYAYTKSVGLIKNRQKLPFPANLIVIFSLGGKQDYLIDTQVDRHSRVFADSKQLHSFKYRDASRDDLNAIGANHRIGLIYHGNKSFENTRWDRVAQ